MSFVVSVKQTTMASLAAPLPASTVVLVRPDDNGGFEVFMNRRPDNMQTYAGVYVFPGGCVEEADCSPDMLTLTRGLAPAEAQAALKSELAPEVCMGHWVAAVRELFEEAGIHFFVSAAGTALLKEGNLARRLLTKRAALQTRRLTLLSLLSAEGLCCDLGSLSYFSHRITPEHYKIRFDTRFFLAALPAQQTPLPISEEVAESLWIRPQAALDRSPSGEFPMMPPTLAVLRTLAEQGSWQSVRATFKV
jgi:8-oxo-dGTP pyrophosphatase MutT (NUDIX family)